MQLYIQEVNMVDYKEQRKQLHMNVGSYAHPYSPYGQL